MKFILSTGKVELTEMEKERLSKRLNRLKKHLKPPFTVEIAADQDTHHRKGEVMHCRIHIKSAGQTKPIYAEKSAETLETACEMAIEVVERELRQAHDKSKQKR